MTSAIVLLLSFGEEIECTAHNTPRKAFEYAVDKVQDDHPRARIRCMDDLREFEEDHGFLFEFRELDFKTLELEEI